MPRRSLLAVPAFALLAFALPVWLFVQKSLPYHLESNAAPVVQAPPEQVRRAAQLSSGMQAIPVLNYHDIANRSGLYSVSPRAFAEQLATLRDAGFQSVTLAQVESLVSGRHTALPARPVLITFDDGIASEYVNADFILERYGFTAVSFLVTGSLAAAGPSYYLAQDELNALKGTGRWSFQAHTDRGHVVVPNSTRSSGPWLTNRLFNPDGTLEPIDAWKLRISADLELSRERIGEYVGQPATAFAYPFSASQIPSNDDRIPGQLRAAVASNFSLAFTASLAPGTAILAGSDRFSLPRFEVTSKVSTSALVDALREMIPQPVGGDPRRWSLSSSGGSCEAGPSSVILVSSTYLRCAPHGATQGWANYAFTASIRGVGRKATAIVSVLDGPAGRVEVAFSDNRMVVRQAVTGAKWRVMKTVLLRKPSAVHQLTITVTGSVLTLTVDAEKPLRVRADPAIRGGGVGFGLAAKGTQKVTVSDIRLDARA